MSAENNFVPFTPELFQEIINNKSDYEGVLRMKFVRLDKEIIVTRPDPADGFAGRFYHVQMVDVHSEERPKDGGLMQIIWSKEQTTLFLEGDSTSLGLEKNREKRAETLALVQMILATFIEQEQIQVNLR